VYLKSEERNHLEVLLNGEVKINHLKNQEAPRWKHLINQKNGKTARVMGL
jgi:hypothetical protein